MSFEDGEDLGGVGMPRDDYRPRNSPDGRRKKQRAANGRVRVNRRMFPRHAQKSDPLISAASSCLPHGDSSLVQGGATCLPGPGRELTATNSSFHLHAPLCTPDATPAAAERPSRECTVFAAAHDNTPHSARTLKTEMHDDKGGEDRGWVSAGGLTFLAWRPGSAMWDACTSRGREDRESVAGALPFRAPISSPYPRPALPNFCGRRATAVCLAPVKRPCHERLQAWARRYSLAVRLWRDTRAWGTASILRPRFCASALVGREPWDVSALPTSTSTIRFLGLAFSASVTLTSFLALLLRLSCCGLLLRPFFQSIASLLQLHAHFDPISCAVERTQSTN
ncbi:hypothetical protein DFH09DRAFT_1086925 [Mycena vulgaris]|nr:hypothetical protein DFH09DRAFT_1086925 [Mycena vulgaris]